MKRPVAVILKEISELPENQRQDALAAQYQNPVLVMSLKYVFDPNIEFDLPGPGVPPYKENAYVDQETNLYQEFRRMYLFIKGGNPNIKDMKRQSMFIQFLEYLHPEDAKYIVGMKDKTMIYPGITYDLVQKTFPGLLPDLSNGVTIKHVEVKQERQKINPLIKNNQKRFTCPYGCESVNNGDHTFSKGNLNNHLKAKHNWTDAQIKQEQANQENYYKAKAS